MKAIYIRVSTDEQNLNNQIKDCIGIAGKDYTLYQDKQSAWKDHKERESFQNLIKNIKKGNITDLYVWDWDRLYRNRKALKSFFELCKACKCTIHSHRQAFMENINKIPEPFNDMVQDIFLHLIGWMAEDESNKKSDRVKASMRKKGNTTVSYKGNKWGRKSLSKKTISDVLQLKAEGKKIREIAELVYYYDKSNNKKNISKSAVHKIIAENTTVKDSI